MAASRLTRVTVSLARASTCGQEGGAREPAILLALSHVEIGQNHARILLERKLDGIAKGELEGRWILGEGAGGEREEYRKPQLHNLSKCTWNAKDCRGK